MELKPLYACWNGIKVLFGFVYAIDISEFPEAEIFRLDYILGCVSKAKIR